MLDTELFDAEAFERALAEAPSPLKVFRAALRHATDTLKRRFLKDSSAVKALVRAHARLIDELLVRAWRQYIPCGSSLGLIAVGGYGRGELHPHSDIDVLILAPEDSREASREGIEGFLLFLWDMGLEVGHSVRSIEDCVEQASQDITVATNLMESRLLAGPEDAYEEMRRQTGRDRIWPSRSFFEAKWQEQVERHHKYHDTGYNLEPNVKESPGGLRDIQMIGWVAKRHFGAATLGDLVDHGFLTEAEFAALDEGQTFLWKVRYGLHSLTGRREDRLLFDHQRALARQFGYQDTDGKLAVEQFMRDYYRTVMELSQLNDLLLQLFQEEILYPGDLEQPTALNKRFQVRKGFIEATGPQVFRRYPFALLEVFVLLAQHPEIKGVRAETIRAIRARRHLIDDKFRSDLRNRSLFMELLRQPRGITHELRRMNRYGILGAYLPVFGKVIGQMQHDLFHVYTVDEHTLFVIRNLRRFSVPEFQHEFPRCSRLINEIPKPEILYIAALFHDIAKGRDGDHSELGAIEVEAFCRSHGLSEYDTGLAAWLVRNHLIMSTTAQRKDISEPEVIHDFATQVGNQNRLNYLYLLTVADIRATSPTVWNSWKDALLAELYESTRQALRRGLANPIGQQELIQATQEEALHLLQGEGFVEEAVRGFWERLGNEYFLRYSAGEIAWHTQVILDHDPAAGPLILIRENSERGGTEIFIYTLIGAHQFTSTTAALDQLGLNIVDARIVSSTDGHTLDSYIVLEESGEPIQNRYRLQEIEDALLQRISHPEAAPRHIHRHIARQLKHFAIPTQVQFQDDPYNPRTIMEVVTWDRPGLLSQIAGAFANCGVRLQNAKIATFGERVEDIFFITDEHNQPLSDEKQRACLRETIIKALEGSPEAPKEISF